MMQLRLKGPQVGSDLGTVLASLGASSDSTTIASYRLPSPQDDFPTIKDVFDSGTLTPDDNGISVTTRVWRAVGGAVLSNGATLFASGLGGQWIEYSPNNGATWSPPVMVYSSTHMGMSASAGHIADDAAVMTIVPHADMTHIAVSDGNWSDSATWNTSEIPRHGAAVLIPHGRTVTYDNAEANIRLDRVRVDGTLNWSLGQSTKMLVETIVVTRGGTVTIGTSGPNRLPANYSAEITFSGKDYSATTFVLTDLKSTRFLSARGWERGFIAQGTVRMWGAEKLTWSKADPIDAGATSLTLHEAPVGWSVGDWIVIGGTDCDSYETGAQTDENPWYPIWQDEERQITAISGNTISWATPLTYAHKNQLVGSTRTDLYPNIMAKGNKNITLRSEVTDPVYRRGHYVQMHHHTVVDLWDAQFIDLGRTDKEDHAGIIDTETDAENPFRVCPNEPGAGWVAQARPLNNRSNLQSRYSIHLHHVGFDHMGARPIVNNCYVEGTPGWGVVHHSCDADFHRVAIYKFYGCGMVSEQADELGGWTECVAMHSTIVEKPSNVGVLGSLRSNPKNHDRRMRAGDGFNRGYGFGYRGRAMRIAGCVANSCTWGHVFSHRKHGSSSSIIVPPVDPVRSRIDIKGVGMLGSGFFYDNGIFEYVDYPIIHFADCESVATFGGMFVTKDAPQQGHDTNINLKRFTSWGFLSQGANVEYVGTYLLSDFDCVSGQIGSATSQGIVFGANTYQVGTVNARVEGCNVAFSADMGAGNATTSGYLPSQDDPRHFHIGWNVVDCDTFNVMTNGDDGPMNVDVLRLEEDLDDTFIDYDQDPSEDFPLVLATMDATGAFTSVPTNSSGSKADNLSSVAKLFNKPFRTDEPVILPFASGAFYARELARKTRGHYSYAGGDAVDFTDIISDRITARPAKITKLITTQSGNLSGTDNGAFVYGASPVAAGNPTVFVEKNGSVTVNVITLASPTGGDGVSYFLNTEDTIKADHGLMRISGNDLTYTPDLGFTGSDETYVIIESGHRFKTVRVSFVTNDAGTDGGITTPVVDTHFSAADHLAANTIGVTLNAPPDTSKRGIRLVQYSTDGGVTWRRLCNGWVQAVHKVTAESDGTAISPGSYNLRIRYKTYADRVTSTASGDDAVTVS